VACGPGPKCISIDMSYLRSVDISINGTDCSNADFDFDVATSLTLTRVPNYDANVNFVAGRLRSRFISDYTSIFFRLIKTIEELQRL